VGLKDADLLFFSNHIEEGKNHTVQEWHVQIKVLTCQSHQEIKMKSKANQDRPEWQAHICRESTFSLHDVVTCDRRHLNVSESFSGKDTSVPLFPSVPDDI
jgi:hypothetical protein